LSPSNEVIVSVQSLRVPLRDASVASRSQIVSNQGMTMPFQTLLLVPTFIT
jgi:hypothetical protein